MCYTTTKTYKSQMAVTTKMKLLQDELKEIEKQIKSFKVTQKHYAILSIENVFKVAKLKKWGICKNNYFIYLYNGGEFWANIEKERRFQSFLGEAAELMGVARFISRWHEFRDTLFKHCNQLFT